MTGSPVAVVETGSEHRAVTAVSVVLAMALVLTGRGFESADAGDSLATFTAHLSSRVPALMEEYDIPGSALALVRGSQLVWSSGYGRADVASSRPMSVDAVFRTESISKSVTTWGVLRLVEQGKLRLDDPVRTYLSPAVLPAVAGLDERVTIRTLLTHTAGLPLGTIGVRYPAGGEVPSLEADLAQEVRAVQEPGSSFSYSNVGYDVLELLVQQVVGRDFGDYMNQEVLTPLGMRTSTFTWHERLRPRVPTAYTVQGTPVDPYVYPARASGGQFATVEDVARFVSAETAVSSDAPPAVLSPGSIRELHRPQVRDVGMYGLVADGYGMGHFLEALPDGRQAAWHGGQGTGWMAHFHAIPSSGEGIVILTNSQRSWPFLAHVLDDWARWSGHQSVKMGRITVAGYLLRAVIGALALLSSWQLYTVGRGLRSGTRTVAPFTRRHRRRRTVLAMLALGHVTKVV